MNRIVPFAGVLNFRDLGGYRTTDGRTTRWGRLFRSDEMHDLTPEDLVAFRRLGVSTVIDLRSSAEVERSGRGLLEEEPLRFFSSPVLYDAAASAAREEMAIDEGYLARRYLQYLDLGAQAFVLAIEEMTVAENYPLVFNCFLGKDRTGVLAALVLSCLGVEREVIVADYALTDERVRLIVEKLRLDPQLVETVDRTNPVLLEAKEATMSAFLDEVDLRFGGARAWLEGVGIAPDRLEQLKGLLLE